MVQGAAESRSVSALYIMNSMKRLLIQLDKRSAAPGKRRRSEFVRQAIRKAIRDAEYQAMREAYRKQPDSAVDADDWSAAEAYTP
jgi:hypothetical protein